MSSACKSPTPRENIKLFRPRNYPILRGSALLLDGDQAFLWTAGYVPRLDTYLGPETPNPLLIRRQRGECAFGTILRDVMGLTKINFNSCLHMTACRSLSALRMQSAKSCWRHRRPASRACHLNSLHAVDVSECPEGVGDENRQAPRDEKGHRGASGLERIARVEPVVPPAPVTFSMTNCCPNS
jgi:hypothetical protein